MTTNTLLSVLITGIGTVICYEHSTDICQTSVSHNQAPDTQIQLLVQEGHSTPPSCYAIEASFDIYEDNMIGEIQAKSMC